MPLFVRCAGLVKVYQASGLEVVALQGLDLAVAEGEMVAVIGNSGSGKSTLLNILGALDTPTAGQAAVGDWDLLRLSPAQRAEYQSQVVGFVWQNPARNLLPYLSGLGNVMLPMALAGRSDPDWGGELLAAVGMAGRVHHRPAQLSGGEQQRVAIAVALANRPRLLLADEPTGAIDDATAGQVLHILREVNRRFGTTVVIVTHDRAVARSVDRYVEIRDGRVAQEAVRRAPAGAGGAAPPPGEPAHEELAVVDAAGRLAIPREYLEAAGITGRARVELDDGRIVIRPPQEGGE